MGSYLRTNSLKSFQAWANRLTILFTFCGSLCLLSSTAVWSENVVVLSMMAIATIMALFISFPDLAVDEHNFYYIRSSLISRFSRSTSYPISSIRSIAYMPLRGTLGERIYVLLELSFIDGRSISYEIMMNEKTVKPIIQRLREELKRILVERNADDTYR